MNYQFRSVTYLIKCIYVSLKNTAEFLSVPNYLILLSVTNTVRILNQSKTTHILNSHSVTDFASTFSTYGLDPTLPHNYCPTSKLPLVSKIVEKVVAKQLLEIMEGSNFFFDKFQSAFRTNYSTEAGLLRVTKSVDSGNLTVLISLDLIAALDTVDQTILLNRLRNWVG